MKAILTGDRNLNFVSSHPNFRFDSSLPQLSSQLPTSPSVTLSLVKGSSPTSHTMDLHETDPATLALIIELQREDIAALANENRVEGRDLDYSRALDIYNDELLRLDRSIAGHQARVRIDRPVATAEAAMTTDQTFEAVQPPSDAAPQHEAQALEHTRETTPNAEEPGDALSIGIQGLEITSSDQDALDQPESSATGASRAHNPETIPPESRECISCQEQHSPTNLAPCPCAHEYCRACIRRVFTNSTLDEFMFPPRCCGLAIPLEQDVQNLLSPDLLEQFEAKKVEFETPNRVYCHQPTCSAFIPPVAIQNNVAECAQCSLATCTFCKAARHAGECPEDPALQEILRVASENGWQRCTNCERIIELNRGCYHMSKVPPPNPAE